MNTFKKQWNQISSKPQLGEWVTIYNQSEKWKVLSIEPNDVYLLGKEDLNGFGPDYTSIQGINIKKVPKLYE